MGRVTPCQRWTEGIHSWRIEDRFGFDPDRYGVGPIPEADAKAFVLRHHYADTYPAARQRYGLFDLTGPAPALVGAAVLSVPVSKQVLTNVFPRLEPYEESLDLGRFVLVDEVPAHGETWFLGQVRRLAAETGLRGLVSFSDPVRRYRLDGAVVMPGHVGTIYQASSAVYTGRSRRRILRLLPDGTVFSDRAAQKVRRQERGHEYAEQRLIQFGARPPRAGEKPAAWLAQALDNVARKLPHEGNHRYAFRLGPKPRARASVVIALKPRPYPKAHHGQVEFDLAGCAA